MTTIVGIAGSARRGSLNAALLGAAIELAPVGFTLEAASIRGIPLYDGDAEKEGGIPESVRALKDRVAAVDGLLIATPEYNNSLPGPMKNAIDWMSRPAADIPRVFGGKPVGLIGATPGRGGTILAQAAWLPVFRALNLRPYFGRTLYAAGAGKSFDAQGKLTDETLKKLLAEFMADFAGFVRG